MDLKSKNISSLGNELSYIDKNIKLIVNSDTSMKKIVFYNGSGENGEINIWNDLDKPLKEFLIEFFNKQKQIVYNKISKELET